MISQLHKICLNTSLQREEKKKRKNHDEILGSSKEYISWVPQQETMENREKDTTRRYAQEYKEGIEQCMGMHEHMMRRKKWHHGQKPNPNYNTHSL